MSEETAKTVIVAGAFVGALAWLVALTFYRRMATSGEPAMLEASAPGRTPEQAIGAVVEQVRQLAAMARFSRPTPTSFSIDQAGMHMHFAAERAGGETRIVAGLDDAKLTRKFRLGMGVLVLLVMPAVVVGLPVGLWMWVAPSAQPAVRWQAIQVVQMVHVLWPPFLVFFIWRAIRKRMSAMAANVLVLAGNAPTSPADDSDGFAR